MRRVLLLFAVMCVCASPALPQTHTIGIYADMAGTNCNILDPSPGTITAYVVHTAPTLTGGSQWAAPITSCMTGVSYVSETNPIGIALGNSQTGITVTYAGFLTGSIHILTITLSGVGTSQACCLWPVVAHPASPFPGEVVWVDDLLVKQVGVGLVPTVNGNVNCPCNLPLEPNISSIEDIPNDQGKQVRVTWDKSAHDATGTGETITEYAIYREIDPNLTAPFAQASERGHDFAATPPGWDYVGSVPADTEDDYSAVVPTLKDSTVTEGQYLTTFLVRARATTPGTFWDSPPDSGYSLDNLEPNIPTAFVVAYNTGSGNTLSWDESPDEDFRYFSVYRGTDPDFTPSPGNRVHTTTGEGWVDPDNDGGMVYYKVTAVDFSGNESDPAMPETLTGIDPDNVPRRLTLYQNVPNPFNPVTTIHYVVPPGGADVSLKIYSASGQLVRVLLEGFQGAGRASAQWDARDDGGRRVASGVYLYRLEASGEAIARKMVLLQ